LDDTDPCHCIERHKDTKQKLFVAMAPCRMTSARCRKSDSYRLCTDDACDHLTITQSLYQSKDSLKLY